MQIQLQSTGISMIKQTEKKKENSVRMLCVMLNHDLLEGRSCDM